MKYRITLYIVFYSCFFLYDNFASPSYQFRYEKVESNLNRLELGMSTDNVRKLVGDPKSEYFFTSRSGETIQSIWILHFRSENTEKIPVLTFNKKDKTLTKIEKLKKDEVIRKID